VYGLHARDILLAMHHLRACARRTFFAYHRHGSRHRLLRPDASIDSANGVYVVPREIPGIVDQVITMASIDFVDGKPIRAFVCKCR